MSSLSLLGEWFSAAPLRKGFSWSHARWGNREAWRTPTFWEETKWSVGRASRKCYTSFSLFFREAEAGIISPEIKIKDCYLHLSLHSVMCIYWFQSNLPAGRWCDGESRKHAIFSSPPGGPGLFSVGWQSRGKCTGLAIRSSDLEFWLFLSYFLCLWGILFSFCASAFSFVK